MAFTLPGKCLFGRGKIPFVSKPTYKLVYFLVFLDIFTYGLVGPVLPFIVQEFGGGAALVGALGSLYALMQLISGPILGPLSDRFGRRPVLLGCILGTAAAYALLGWSSLLVWVFVAIALDGLTGGNLTTAQAYVVDITSPEERARGLGMLGAAMGLGLMVGPAVGGILGAFDLRWPVWAGLSAALLNVGLGLFLLPESLPPERRAKWVQVSRLHIGAQVVEIARRPVVRWLLLVLFALNLSFSGLQSNFPLFSQARFGWAGLQNGLFFAFVGLVGVFTQGVLVGWLTRRLGERRLVLLGMALPPIMLLGVALNQQAGWLFGWVGLLAFGTSLAIPVLSSLVSQWVEPESQGRVLAGMQSFLSLAAILGPSIAGVSFERLDMAAPYFLGAGIAALAFLSALAGRAKLSPPAAG